MKPTRVKAKKRWSQNFFNDAEVLADLVDLMGLTPEDQVLEIGPGLGVMTEILLKQAQGVTAVEIDPDLVQRLEKHFAGHPRFSLVHQDILTYDLGLFAPETPLQNRKVIANIPYHITTPIMLYLLQEKRFKAQGISPDLPLFGDIFLMVQKEVAERIVSPAGNKNFGAISHVVNFAAETELLAVIPKHFYTPRPKVDSAILRLKPRQNTELEITHYGTFWSLIRTVFQYRRKTLRNVLKALQLTTDQIEAISQDWDLKIRGETFELGEMADLANRIADLTLLK